VRSKYGQGHQCPPFLRHTAARVGWSYSVVGAVAQKGNSRSSAVVGTWACLSGHLRHRNPQTHRRPQVDQLRRCTGARGIGLGARREGIPPMLHFPLAPVNGKSRWDVTLVGVCLRSLCGPCGRGGNPADAGWQHLPSARRCDHQQQGISRPGSCLDHGPSVAEVRRREVDQGTSARADRGLGRTPGATPGLPQ
jgi:hypothetical protein